MPRHAAVVSLSPAHLHCRRRVQHRRARHTHAATPSLSVGNPLNTGAANPFTLAVIGDMPYGPRSSSTSRS